MAGNQLSPEVVNKIERITRQYFDEKGFKNADVRVRQEESLSAPNEMILTIDVTSGQRSRYTRYTSTATRCFLTVRPSVL